MILKDNDIAKWEHIILHGLIYQNDLHIIYVTFQIYGTIERVDITEFTKFYDLVITIREFEV